MCRVSTVSSVLMLRFAMLRMAAVEERYCYAKDGNESKSIGAENCGGSVGEPHESDWDRKATDGRARAKSGKEQKGHPGGRQKFGEGGALEGAEKHIRVGEIERSSDESCVCAREAAG